MWATISPHCFRATPQYRSRLKICVINFKALTDCSHLRDEIASDLNENLLSRKLRLWAFKRRKKWYDMISYMADGKSAIFYTIKLWREAPIFLHYQTFAETECGKVILSNFRSDPNEKSHTIKLCRRRRYFFCTVFFRIRDLRIHI